jgi:hypothetical protein
MLALLTSGSDQRLALSYFKNTSNSKESFDILYSKRALDGVTKYADLSAIVGNYMIAGSDAQNILSLISIGNSNRVSQMQKFLAGYAVDPNKALFKEVFAKGWIGNINDDSKWSTDIYRMLNSYALIKSYKAADLAKLQSFDDFSNYMVLLAVKGSVTFTSTSDLNDQVSAIQANRGAHPDRFNLSLVNTPLNTPSTKNRIDWVAGFLACDYNLETLDLNLRNTGLTDAGAMALARMFLTNFNYNEGGKLKPLI